SDHQAEVPAATAVGADVEDIALGSAAVVHLVLVVLLARQDRAPRRGGSGGRAEARLGAGEAAGDHEQVSEASRAADVQPEERIRLFLEEIRNRHPEAET